MHRQTRQLLKLKILYKESIAENLKQKNESELEDKMLEITSEEQSKVKRMKRPEDTPRDLWDSYQVLQHSNSRGPRSRREKERV